MKNCAKKIVSITLVSIICFVSCFLAEAAITPKDTMVANAASVAADTLAVKKSVINGNEITTIDNIQLFKNNLKKKCKFSNSEIAKQIYKLADEDDDVITRFSDNQLLEALDFKSCIQKVSYMQFTKEDGQINMTKQDVIKSLLLEPNRMTQDGFEFLEKNNINKAENIAPLDSSTDTITSDGYLQLTTKAWESPGSMEGRTYYTISANAVWLKVPTFLRQDVLAITSNATYDNNFDDYGWFYENVDEYIGSNSTDPNNYCGRIELDNYIFKNTGPVCADGDVSFEYTAGVGGIAFRFDMYEGSYFGDTAHNFVYNNIKAYLCYKVSLYNMDGGVQAAYGHKQFSFSDISVSLAPLAISFSIKGWMAKYYGEPLSIYYLA